MLYRRNYSCLPLPAAHPSHEAVEVGAGTFLAREPTVEAATEIADVALRAHEEDRDLEGRAADGDEADDAALLLRRDVGGSAGVALGGEGGEEVGTGGLDVGKEPPPLLPPPFRREGGEKVRAEGKPAFTMPSLVFKNIPSGYSSNRANARRICTVDAKIIVEIHTNSKQFCKFATQIAINNFMDIKDNIKRYSSPEECKEALRGMLKVKEQWLEYVKRREKELALS